MTNEKIENNDDGHIPRHAPPVDNGKDWAKLGFRRFESFAEKWEDYYDSLEDFYTSEFDPNYFKFEQWELEIDPKETEDDVEAYADYDRHGEVIETDKTREEWQKCAQSFPYFCHKYVKIGHPKRGLVPFRLYNYQRRVIGEYDQHQFNIISKFRQGGLTTVSSLWGLWRCMFRLDQNIMVLSKTDREAIAAGEIAARALEHLPKWLKPKFGKNNDHQRQFKETGCWLYFYTPEAARGKSITYLIIDEAAFINDMHRHWKSMYPTLSTGGNCIVVSTVNGIGNWYEDTYTRAKEGRNEFNIIDLDYYEHPDYHDDDWVRKTKANLGEKGWKQEVLRHFLGSGETYINSEIIGELMQLTQKTPPSRKLFTKFTNADKDIDYMDEFNRGALWVWKEPIDGHEYIMGVDCAEGIGEDNDNSTFQILDMSTLEQVAEFYSNVTPPHVFAQIVNEVGVMYNTAIVVVEAAAPAGGAVLNSLHHKLYYENLYWDTGKTRASGPGLKSNQAVRPVILECMSSRLLDKTLKLYSTRLVDEIKTFIYNGQKRRAEALAGKHDDAIMALCIALYARESMSRDVPVGSEMPDELQSVLDSSVYKEIKEELKRGAPINWLEDDGSDEDLLGYNEDQNALWDYKPKYHKLLREFGWW